MKKNIFYLLTIVLGLAIFGIIVIGFYYLFALIDEKSQILKLEKYKILPLENILTEFKYEKYEYVISSYYDDTSSWSHLNILLKLQDKYYRLEEIKKCDGSGKNIYVKDNKVYIHCIGKKGDILEYTINDTKIEKNIRQLNYDNTPNISQIHILIDKIDNEYIYLYSNVKINDSIKEGKRVKCSLKNNICDYY